MEQNIRKYATKQAIITGIITVLLNLTLFFFLVKSGVELSAIFLDLSITVGTTGFICGLLQVFLTKGPVKKGLVPVVGNLDDQAAYLLIPKNSGAFLVYLVIVELLLFAFAPIGILSMFLANSGELSRMAYIVLKALLGGSAAAYSTYHANIFICSLHQKKLKIVTK